MPTILLIEDDADVRSMLAMMLVREGYEVRETASGKHAIALYRECPSDLVITDIVMPDTDGLETIMSFRREFPDAPIIAISGGGRVAPDTYLESAQLFGASRTFRKPVRRDDLIQAIRELVGA